MAPSSSARTSMPNTSQMIISSYGVLGVGDNKLITDMLDIDSNRQGFISL